ncbi:hypothetical protein N7462_005967 [Penicillium macrosclerotiorum]|uniref:uncharacterized protein n=1 Tax=Penicillium macrosclerotiorum TaxID=303699 RepID=UPI002546C310|nr:uncharacterized protein N7462_005967 [Penicillium macrosclerotiorum]KAJ5682802.1 hypothetical protein N7462_005967 [Penicillium macrosclerotiorum]
MPVASFSKSFHFHRHPTLSNSRTVTCAHHGHTSKPPPPSSQRLIFRGKPLLNDNLTLSSIFGPIEESVHTIHLVLPPSPTSAAPSISNPTAQRALNTVETGNAFRSTGHQVIPDPATEGLRLRGQMASNTNPEDDLHGVSANFRRHMHALAEQHHGVQVPSNAPGQEPYSQLNEFRPAQERFFQHEGPGVLYQRHVVTSIPSNESFAYDQIQPMGPSRGMDHNNYDGRSHHHGPFTEPASSNGHVPASTTSRSRNRPSDCFDPLYPVHHPTDPPSDPPAPPSNPAHYRTARHDLSRPEFSNSSQPSSNPGFPSENTPPVLDTGSAAPSPGAALGIDLANIREFDELRVQVEEAERLVHHGISPSSEVMFRVRTRLQALFRETHSSPRQNANFGMAVNDLLNRTFEIFRLVDRLAIHPPSMPAFALPSSMQQVFLATAPDGRQSLIMPPGVNTMPTTTHYPSALQHQASTNTSDGNHGAHPQGHQLNQDPAAAQNLVRQALINQQRRRDAENIPPERLLRRIWLFIRLYFVCYMISGSGTWMRVLLVTGAVIVALLSDTQIPEQLRAILVAPIQRHLEGLAHVGGPAERGAQAGTEQNAGDRRANTFSGELWHHLRRAERSIVLLLASLVPGIGERQVEARNAAEAEERRRREEEEERIRSEQREQEQAQQEETQGVTQQEMGAGELSGPGEQAIQAAPSAL